MPKTYFWQGCLNQSEFPEYTHVIERILRNEARIPQMVNHLSIRKTRINGADRLLFTTIVDENDDPDKKPRRPYIAVVDVVLFHNYTGAHILQKGVLENVINTNHIEWQRRIKQKQAFLPDDVQAAFDLEDALEETNRPNLADLIYTHKPQPIIFDELQEAIFDLPHPVLISGPAGTGKTEVIEELIRDLLLSMPKDDPRKLLFLTHNPNLVNQRITSWKTLADPIVRDDPRVVFQSYSDFLLSKDPRCRPENQVGMAHFKTWLNTYLHKKIRDTKQHDEKNALQGLQSRPIKLLYEECRVISGYQLRIEGINSDSYIALGRKQSDFHEVASTLEKKCLLNAYNAYYSYLQPKQGEDIFYFDPSFYAPDATTNYYATFIDEVADFALGPILTLAKNTDDYRMYLAGDTTHQRTSDMQSLQPMLLDLLGKTASRAISHSTLSAGYRCPKAIIRVVNELIRLRNISTGGISEESELTEITPHPSKEEGELRLLDPSKNEDLELRTYAKSTNCIVIAGEGFEDEARLRYGAPTVFNHKTAKGIQARWVILYKFFSNAHKQFREANQQLLSKPNYKTAIVTHFAKLGQSYRAFIELYNSGIINLTRGTGGAYLVQLMPENDLPPILERISVVNSNINQITINYAVANATSDTAHWERKADEYILAGVPDTDVIRIYVETLGKTKEQYLARKIVLTQKPSVPTIVQDPTEPTSSQRSKSNQKKNINTQDPVITAQPKQAKIVLPTQNTVSQKTAISTLSSQQAPNQQQTNDAHLGEDIDRLCNNFMAHELDTLFQKYQIRFLSETIYLRNQGDYSLLEDILSSATRSTVFCNYLETYQQQSTNWIRLIATQFCLPDGSSALHLAAFLNHPRMMRLLLDNGASVSTSNKHNERPLYTAIVHESVDAIDILIHEGAVIDDAMKEGLAPFYLAVNYNSLYVIDVINKSQRQYDNEQSLFLRLPETSELFIAAQNNNCDRARELLSISRCDINKPTGVMQATPLLIAVQHGHTQMVKLLVQHGAHINQHNQKGVFALLLAAQLNHIDILVFLLKNGADVEQQTSDGCTALISASALGHAQIVKTLLYANAEDQQRLANGANAMDIAIQSNIKPIIALMKLNMAYCDYAHALVGKFSNDQLLHAYQSELFIPCFYKHMQLAMKSTMLFSPPRLVIAVLFHYPNFNRIFCDFLRMEYQNTSRFKNLGVTPVLLKLHQHALFLNEHTPLHIAICVGSIEAVQLHVDLHFNINNNDPQSGISPLFLACQLGRIEIVKILLSADVDVFLSTDNGRSPLRIAVEAGHLGIVCLLINTLKKKNRLDHVNFGSENGYDILATALELGFDKIASLLINVGADHTIPHTDGRTPWTIAAIKGYTAITALLLAKASTTSTATGSSLLLGQGIFAEKKVNVTQVEVNQRTTSPLYLA